MSRINKGLATLGATALVVLSIGVAVPANATYGHSEPKASLGVSVSCVDGTPVGTVTVNVESVPEGAWDLGVFDVLEYQPLDTGNPVRSNIAPGTYTFTGPVPVGDTSYFLESNDLIIDEFIISAEDCAPPTPVPPTFVSLDLDAYCVEASDSAEASAVVVLDAPTHNAAEFTLTVDGSDGTSLDLVGIDGSSYYFAGPASPGSKTYTAVLNGVGQSGFTIEVPVCAVTPPVTPPVDPPAPQPPVVTPEQPAPQEPVVHIPSTNEGVTKPGATGDIVSASAANPFIGFGALGAAAVAGLAWLFFVRRNKTAADS